MQHSTHTNRIEHCQDGLGVANEAKTVGVSRGNGRLWTRPLLRVRQGCRHKGGTNVKAAQGIAQAGRSDHNRGIERLELVDDLEHIVGNNDLLPGRLRGQGRGRAPTYNLPR
jgi:hypothetical protein